MNIPEAFEASNQEAANVVLDEEEFDAVTSHLHSLMEERVESLNNLNINEDQVQGALLREGLNLALRAFVAGRCYEEQYANSETFPIDLPKDVLSDFIEFLSSRRA